MVRNKKDFDAGDTSNCPDDDCYCLTVTITSGDLTEVDCLEAAHNTYTLPPSQVYVAMVIFLFDSLLSYENISINLNLYSFL